MEKIIEEVEQYPFFTMGDYSKDYDREDLKIDVADEFVSEYEIIMELFWDMQDRLEKICRRAVWL